VAEINRLAPLEAEQFFDERPVDDRRFQYFEAADDVGKLKKPLTGSWHRGRIKGETC
jgi:hypothetical protein